MADPWAEFRSTLPAAPQGSNDPWAAFRKQEQAAEIKPAAQPDFVAPEAPPGVNIHMGNGQNVRSLGGGQYEKQTDAEARARAGREAGGSWGDRADAVLRGLPFVGGFLDRAKAGTQAAIGNGDYASNLESERARQGTYDKDNPVESTALKIGGGIAGTVAVSPVAAALGAPAQYAFGIGAKTLPNAIARGAVAGTLQGAASGVGRSKDITDAYDVATNAGADAAFGGAIGAAIPAAIGAGGMVVDKLRNLGTDTLSPLSRGSKSIVADYLLDPQRLQAQRQAVQALGPQGMLADVSPEWGMVARGSAARPGGRDAVIDALNARDAAKNTRINTTVDAELGKAPIPSTVMRDIKAAEDALSPEYKRVFSNAKAVDTQGVANKLDTLAIDKRGPGATAAAEVRDMLNIRGTKTLDPNPQTLHETRMAIDGMRRASNDPKVKSVLTEARQAIDEELAAKVPGIKAVDSQYAALQRQREAFERGQTVFDTGRETVLRPPELAELQNTYKQPAGTAQGPPTSAALDQLSSGARAELDRIVGTNANDVAKLNQVLKSEGDWNRNKLRMLFGSDKADKVLNVLDAERAMEATHRTVAGNSATASTLGFKEMLDDVAKGTDVPLDTTLTGLTARSTQKLVRALSQANGGAKADQIARDLGRLSVAQGSARDQIISDLLKRGVRKSQLQQIYEAGGAAGGALANPIVQALIASRDRR